MDRELPVVPSLIFIVSLIMVIALYMQVSPQLHRPPVSQILNTDGGLSVVYKNRLVALELSNSNISFSDYGVSQYVGEVMPLVNGAWLLNTGWQHTSLWHKWRRYERKTEVQADGGSSLLRCDKQFIACTPWGNQELHFDTPWSGVSISDDRHVILDTARHKLYLINDAGELLDTLEGFRFPNHATLYDGLVWVVDTNRNRLVPLRMEGDQLITSGEPISLYSFDGISSEHRFPSMVYRSSNAWYVLTHANGMNDGKVYRLESGKATQLFESQSDITTLHFGNNHLTAAAFSDHSLWSMNVINNELKSIESVSFNEALSLVDHQIRLQRLEFYLYAGFIIAIGLFALVFSLIKSSPSSENSRRILVPPHSKIAEFSGANGEVIWLTRNAELVELYKKSERYFVIINWSVAAVIMIMGVFILKLGTDDALLRELVLLVLLFCTIILSLPWIIKRIFAKILDSRLGSDGESLFLSDVHSIAGRRKIDLQNAIYSNHDLFDGANYLAWQNYAKVYYDKAEFESLVSPLLREARKVGHMRMYLARLKAGERTATTELLFIMMAFIAYVSLKSANVI